MLINLPLSYKNKTFGKMKSIEVRLPKEFDKSFVVFKEKGPYFPCSWHYHPEYELVLVLKSICSRLLCYAIGYYQDGDVVCMGSYLPHDWINDSIYHTEHVSSISDTFIIQLKEDF